MAGRGPRYTEHAAREAVAASRSYSEPLRRLGMCEAGGSHAVLWQNGSLVDLGALPGGTISWPNAINIDEQIVGVSSLVFSSGDFAVVWQDGEIHNLGTLPGGNFSQAADINARGQVVGVSNSPAGFFGVLWEAGTVRELRTASGEVLL